MSDCSLLDVFYMPDWCHIERGPVIPHNKNEPTLFRYLPSHVSLIVCDMIITFCSNNKFRPGQDNMNHHCRMSLGGLSDTVTSLHSSLF